MNTINLTMSQALVRYLANLRVETESGVTEPYCAGVFTIFGHGNVAGLGEALWAYKDQIPTLRAHNEQAMAHSAIAYSKANFRQKIMAVSTSIGPGATNMVTAAALAHVNRLPVLLLPSDTFISRKPDPVLQQIEDFQQGDVTANDAFRSVTRFFDRITTPEQLLVALPRAIAVMTDPAQCGPVCLALPQDVQTMAYDYPASFFEPEVIRLRRSPPDSRELERAVQLLSKAKKPLIVAGGGVLYSLAGAQLQAFASQHAIPVAETQAGKSSLPWNDPLNLGSLGVTGSPAANSFAQQADLVLAVGTRLQDFTTGSNSLFVHAPIISLNVQSFDASKRGTTALQADAKVGLLCLSQHLGSYLAQSEWTEQAKVAALQWQDHITDLTTREVAEGSLPYDAEVIGAVRDSALELGLDSAKNDVVVCAAGTLPAELHKLWRADGPGNYHMEYGYSCMGYEIAGGLGVKLARPHQEVIVMVGDGSYMMMNSEIATSVMLGKKIIVVVLDNRGYGCIQRLQISTGSPRFNNMLDDCVPEGGAYSTIDFAMHAKSMGANSVHVKNIAQLKTAMVQARQATTTQVLVIDTTHTRTTEEGGHWWEVAIPEVSSRDEVKMAYANYQSHKKNQRN